MLEKENPTKMGAPTLLKIPREIRNRIYSYFLTIDQHYEQKGDGGCDGKHFDVTILHINKQIRAEAWDSLIKTNHRVAMEHAKLLLEEVAIHLWVSVAPDIKNNTNSSFDGSDTEESYLFAYHPLFYNMLIHNLASYATQHSGLTIYASLPTKNMTVGPRTMKLFDPLLTLRDFQSVSFSQVQDQPSLQLLARLMKHSLLVRAYVGTKKSFNITELMHVQLHHQRLGRAAELQGHYSEAMCHFNMGGWLVENVYPKIAGRRVGSLESNSSCYLATDLLIGFSRNVHKHVARIQKFSPNSTLKDQIEPETIHNSIWACCQALQFVGISDRHRREAHLYRAFTLYRVADTTVLIPLGPGPNVKTSRPPPLPHRNRSKVARFAAAHDLYYAMNVKWSYDLLSSLEDEDDKALFRRIKPLTASGFPLIGCQVPLLGLWEGDPVVCSLWCRQKPGLWNLMKLLRQRLDITGSPDDDAVGEEQLAMQYADVGISWEYNNDMLMVTVDRGM
ncbi:hypothetical protein PG990_001784 [Apiospora arundinis]